MAHQRGRAARAAVHARLQVGRPAENLLRARCISVVGSRSGADRHRAAGPRALSAGGGDTAHRRHFLGFTGRPRHSRAIRNTMRHGSREYRFIQSHRRYRVARDAIPSSCK
ncbi:hypothetical protein BVI434_720013 [Burkholderia vietnamiensis]|nr:hypothetical protein BVI434_720013 [Burkholderia vietnamiensis]